MSPFRLTHVDPGYGLPPRSPVGVSSIPNAWRVRYDALRAPGLVCTAYRITPLYFAGRCGRGAGDYWQAVVDIEQGSIRGQSCRTSMNRGGRQSPQGESPEKSKPPIGPAV